MLDLTVHFKLCVNTGANVITVFKKAIRIKIVP